VVHWLKRQLFGSIWLQSHLGEMFQEQWLGNIETKCVEDDHEMHWEVLNIVL